MTIIKIMKLKDFIINEVVKKQIVIAAEIRKYHSAVF